MKFLQISPMVLLIALITGCGLSVSEDEYLSKAQAFLDEGNNKAALIELKNALQKNPDHQLSRLILGKLYLKTGNYPGAEKELKRAQKLGAADQDVLPYLSIALARLRKHQELEKLSPDTLPSQDRAVVIASKGLGKLQQNKQEEALNLTTEAVRLNAQNPYTHFAQANALFLTEKSYNAARRALEQAIKIDDEYGPAWTLLGDIEARENNFQAAIEAYNKAISYSGNNYAELNKRAMAYIQTRDLEAAQKDIDKLIKVFPQHPGINYAQGLIYYEQARLDDAKSAFESALPGVEQYPITLFQLANISYKQNELAQAETYAEQFLSRAPDHILGQKLLALIKYKNQKLTEVEPILATVLEKHPNDIVALNLLAHVRFKQNRPDSGIKLLRKVVELEPDSIEANLNLASSLINTGQTEKGFALLDEIGKLNQETSLPLIVKTLSYLKLGRFDEALKTVELFKQSKPESATAYNLEGQIYLASDNLESAVKAFTNARKLDQRNLTATLNLAQISRTQEQPEKAETLFNEILTYQPDHLPSLLGLASIQKSQGNDALMVKTLEQAMQKHPAAVAPRVQLARHFIKNGQTSKIPGLLETVEADIKDIPDVKEILIHMHISKQEYSYAEHLAKQLINQLPDSAIPHFLLSQVYAGMGDSEKSDNALKKAIAVQPDYVPARIVLLRKMLSTGDASTLKKEIASIKKLDPDNEDILQLEVSITRKANQHREALQLAEALHQQYPTWTNTLILANQRLAVGNEGGFIELHKQWIEEHPKDIQAILSLAGHYQVTGQDDAAIQQYQKIQELQPDNVAILNNLAWLLRKTAPVEALQHAQKANELQERSAALMDTLALVYLENDDYAKAKNVIKEVQFIAPNNKTYQYHQAIIMHRAGETEQARQVLDQLLQSNGDFPERDEATLLRDEINRR